jgi:hypothetical protein
MDQLTIARGRPFKMRGRGGGLGDRFGKLLLAFKGKPDDLSAFNRPLRGLLGGGNDEVANVAALDLRGA